MPPTFVMCRCLLRLGAMLVLLLFSRRRLHWAVNDVAGNLLLFNNNVGHGSRAKRAIVVAGKAHR